MKQGALQSRIPYGAGFAVTAAAICSDDADDDDDKQ